MDPGIANFAWAILKVRKPFTFRVIASGDLKHTVKALKGPMSIQASNFIKELKALRRKYQVDSVVMERYMSRGHGGTNIELVNSMIGLTMGFFHDKSDRFILLTSATWKNAWNRHSDLEAFYKKVKCTPHQVDSVGIGLYSAALWLGEKPFTFFDPSVEKAEEALAKQINRTNQGQVINRKVRHVIG
jgi:hypothetical protein